MSQLRTFSSCILWALLALVWTLTIQIGGVEGTPEPHYRVKEEEALVKDAAFHDECTLKHVENVCTRNITMAQEDGSRVRAPGVSIWIQAHCGNEHDEHKRALCVLSYIADDFGDEQANEFFSCVCVECPRACKRKGNLRNRQNMIAMESQLV